MEKLFRKFYKDFRIILLLFLFSAIGLLLGLVLTLLAALKTGGKLYLPIFFGVLLLIILVWAVSVLKPFWKDWKLVRKKTCSTITGKVVRYRQDRNGKDASATLYYPIIKPDFGTEEIELCVEGTELHKHYTFYCLKHTRLAVIADKAEEKKDQTTKEEPA